MEKEEMSKLGFSKRPRKNVSSTAYQKVLVFLWGEINSDEIYIFQSKESKGFIAGLNK